VYYKLQIVKHITGVDRISPFERVTLMCVKTEEECDDNYLGKVIFLTKQHAIRQGIVNRHNYRV